MSKPLFIRGAGAVTPGGLDLPQTLAAFLATLTAAAVEPLPEPFGVSQALARVPADGRLRPDEGRWLVNLAARAIGEALAGEPVARGSVALLATLPDPDRGHPAYDGRAPGDLLDAIAAAAGGPFHPASRSFDGGAGGIAALLSRAREILEREGATDVLVGGVDSLLNTADLDRLRAAGRLKGPNDAQGLVPGEGAAFVRLALRPRPDTAVPVSIAGVGHGTEVDHAGGPRFSQGRGGLAALRAAVAIGPAEPEIAFLVSNANGERHRALEDMITHARFYRTRRPLTPIALPAMTVGEVGAASGALAIAVAADALARGHAPGPVAMCEIGSETGQRSAVLVRRG